MKAYKWGLGIEHEMHIFHQPKSSKNNIKDFVLFDSFSAVERILKKKEMLSMDDYNFLKKSVPFETSGRRCNNEWVIETVPVKMPEFITNYPFSSINDKRDILNKSNDIIEYKNKFYELLMLDEKTRELVKKYGKLGEHPFGMTRTLKCPVSNINGIYKFKKDMKGNDILLPEYNGSYHITFTLPYKKSTTNKEFIKMHQNFCNQLQWLEPLLLTSYFTGDEYAPGSGKDRVRGSFRVMIIGWGNFAGTDIRLLDKGIGRYAKTPTYWRDNLYFKDVDKLKPCFKPSPMALREGATTTLSSDFRTFGSPDPDRPEHRESGIGMNKPNGVEFRIFDHFQDRYISHLVTLMSLVAENSRITKTTGYVYENKIWIKELHNIMTYGYKAKLSEDYIDLLRKKLGLKISTRSIIAFDIFEVICKELWNKNKDGKWSKIFNCDMEILYDKFIHLTPEINKKGWQFAFMIKANRDQKLLDNFNNFSKYLNKVKIIDYKDFSNALLYIFGNKWRYDVEDIAYFYESLKYYLEYDNSNNSNNNVKNIKVELIKNEYGIIEKIKILKKIPKFKNFNDRIIDYFGNNGINNLI
jgi:hypothetical protein